MAEAIPETIQDNPRIRITINIGYLKMSSKLHVYDDISDVRQIVSDEFDIAIEEQIIEHRGRVIGNEEIVRAIFEHRTVDIKWKNSLSLIIKSDNLTQGGTFKVSVPRSGKIFFLLELISNKIELKYNEFYIVWSGIRLDNNKLISDYNMQNEDVLQVHVRGVGGMVVCVVCDNNTRMIPFSPDQSVREFKKIVQVTCDIKEFNSIKILLDNTPLINNRLMRDYNIQSGDTLFADKYLRGGGGIGVIWMASYFESVDSFPKVTIRELKEKISKEIKKPVDKFTIKYNRTEFTDLNKTLKQYLIDHEMTLNIEDKY